MSNKWKIIHGKEWPKDWEGEMNDFDEICEGGIRMRHRYVVRKV